MGEANFYYFTCLKFCKICLCKNSINQKNGSRSHENGQEGGESYRGEILHEARIGFPYQQENCRGGRHHSFKEGAQPNRWLRDASYEENPKRTRQRYLHQAPRGGARAS